MSEDKFNEALEDDRIERLLDEIYSEEIAPSQELVKMTKASLRRPGLLEHVITLSIITSFASALFSGYMIIFKLHDILKIITAVSISSFITNIVIILIFIYKNDIKKLFRNLEV